MTSPGFVVAKSTTTGRFRLILPVRGQKSKVLVSSNSHIISRRPPSFITIAEVLIGVHTDGRYAGPSCEKYRWIRIYRLAFLSRNSDLPFFGCRIFVDETKKNSWIIHLLYNRYINSRINECTVRFKLFFGHSIMVLIQKTIKKCTEMSFLNSIFKYLY